MREGVAKIAREYVDPPEGGALVPRAWVEEQLLIPELPMLEDAVSELLPEGYRFSYELTPVLPACGKEIRYVTPGGSRGSEPCALLPDHEGDCDSPNLFLRPADAPKIWLP